MEKVNKKREDEKQKTLEFETSVIGKPIIDEVSKKIVEEKLAEKRNKPTHERLYELDKEMKQKKLDKAEQLHNKFKEDANATIRHNQSVSVKREG